MGKWMEKYCDWQAALKDRSFWWEICEWLVEVIFFDDSLEFGKSTDEQQIVNKYKDCLSFTLTKAVQIKAT